MDRFIVPPEVGAQLTSLQLAVKVRFMFIPSKVLVASCNQSFQLVFETFYLDI
jgi:hypothetical protein